MFFSEFQNFGNFMFFRNLRILRILCFFRNFRILRILCFFFFPLLPEGEMKILLQTKRGLNTLKLGHVLKF